MREEAMRDGKRGCLSDDVWMPSVLMVWVVRCLAVGTLFIVMKVGGWVGGWEGDKRCCVWLIV